MTDQMSIPLKSTANMDEGGDLMTKTLEQRKEAFKENEELMRETTKFVSEVIDTAAKEASKRKIQSEVNEMAPLKQKFLERRCDARTSFKKTLARDEIKPHLSSLFLSLFLSPST